MKVVDRLEKIRTAQEVYKMVTGAYAPRFDTLVQVLKTDSVKVVKVFGNADDVRSTEEFREEISYTNAMDTLRSILVKNKHTFPNLDSLQYVPYTQGERFSISADTLTYQSTLVNVVEVGTRWKTFMGKYASPSYSKYDNSYDPNRMIKFGDMNAPNLGGNWPMN